MQPTIGPGCKVTAGQWYSFYDGVTVTAPGGLDIDHMVPLAEAWDSGASAWTPERREAYANDLDAESSLVAVTARTNRSKADQDPADWLTPLLDARCTYAADWVATKLRWKLAVDDRERFFVGFELGRLVASFWLWLCVAGFLISTTGYLVKGVRLRRAPGRATG
ncbi:HNH endonuclease family protein [Leifsonia sp. NPDC102414]|uniref:HNH endonuclease family protein n=1 Tax=Leifsonia sp. NPDC102414 TaxID=3364124 RepID=UPI00380F62CF